MCHRVLCGAGWGFSDVTHRPFCAPNAIFPQSVRRAGLFAHRRRNKRPPAAKAKRCAELHRARRSALLLRVCVYATWVSENKITFHGGMPLKALGWGAAWIVRAKACTFHSGPGCRPVWQRVAWKVILLTGIPGPFLVSYFRTIHTVFGKLFSERHTMSGRV